MGELIASVTSLVHVGFAVLSLLSGTLVIVFPKGTIQHQRIGYAYVASMVIVLTTAFGIYRLFGRFGIVHWGAVFSWLVLLAGLGAVWFRTYIRNWRYWHYLGMSLSVTSLYATFIVEATYRLFPPRFFWWATVGTSAVIFCIAGLLIVRYAGNLRQAPILSEQTQSANEPQLGR
ncbi:hypothetical protein [Fibrella arboris]|uniref:hypothetical protein n=1 Tax=Fibrella arboris TaxID=3242486 RepID=UPI0035226E50